MISGADRLTATRWSIVMRSTGEPESARAALGELARRYWYPVYVYLRRCGHSPATASDLARRFLHQLVGDAGKKDGPPSQTHYRSYLLARLCEYLANKQDTIPVAGDAPDMPNDLEERYQHDHVDAPSPEQSYQRAFALQVLHRTLRRLRSEADQTGHVPMYERLEPFLAREPVPGEYEAAALALHTRPLTIVVALKRLRQRFRELASEELFDTVATSDELVAEQDALLAVLGSTGT